MVNGVRVGYESIEIGTEQFSGWQRRADAEKMQIDC